MMKKNRLLLGLAAVLVASMSLPVQAGYNCGIKIQKLEQQLGYAKAYGNTNRVRGLQRALANVKARCGVANRPVAPAIATAPAISTLPATPSQTHAQAWREIEISKQALAVEKLEIELQQALNDGNVQQAAYQGMLLEQAEAALATLRAQ